MVFIGASLEFYDWCYKDQPMLLMLSGANETKETCYHACQVKITMGVNRREEEVTLLSYTALNQENSICTKELMLLTFQRSEWGYSRIN